jgi:hypothetical protein
VKGPSIAVMLGHPSEDAESGEGLSSEESKSAGSDAGKALISAVKAGNGEAVYRAFCAMKDLHESEDDEEAAEKDAEEGPSDEKE